MEWTSVALKKLVILGPQYGANARAISPTGNQPRYVRITDIDSNGRLLPDGIAEADIDDPSAYQLEEGDLVFARSGATVGKTYLHQQINGPCIFAGYLIRFRPNKKLIDPRYLFYYTKSGTYYEWVANRKRTAAQPNINGTEYASLAIPLLPLSEQRRIVEILDQADALRKKHAEADAKAERILPALFYKMFGDPARNPKRLRKEKLGSLIKVKSGEFLPAKSMDSNGSYPVYGGNGINGYHSECMFEKPVIVIGRVGVYCGSVHYAEPKSWVTDNALYVSEMSNDLHIKYLAAALQMANLNQYAGRAGQPLISASRIYPVEILVPDFDAQKQYAVQSEVIEQYAQNRQQSREKINTLFSTLLYRAFSGDLTAKWRETHAKELLAEMEEQAKMLKVTN